MENKMENKIERKSKGTTLVLCLLLGWMGAHRFYTGHTGMGIICLFTGGCCGVIPLIDFITILTGSYKDSRGFSLAGGEFV